MSSSTESEDRSKYRFPRAVVVGATVAEEAVVGATVAEETVVVVEATVAGVCQ